MHLRLAKIHIFAGLKDEALKLLEVSAKKQLLPVGAIIVREGETGHSLFVIAEGVVRISKHFDRADAVELAVLGPGEFFGEMCILETLPRCATAVAATSVTIFSLCGADFHHLYKAMPDQYGILMLNLARDLSRRLRRLDEAFAARH